MAEEELKLLLFPLPRPTFAITVVSSLFSTYLDRPRAKECDPLFAEETPRAMLFIPPTTRRTLFIGSWPPHPYLTESPIVTALEWLDSFQALDTRFLGTLPLPSDNEAPLVRVVLSGCLDPTFEVVSFTSLFITGILRVSELFCVLASFEGSLSSSSSSSSSKLLS